MANRNRQDIELVREIQKVLLDDANFYAKSFKKIYRRYRERNSWNLFRHKYAVSDDHKGLVRATKRAFQDAGWQRC